MMLYLLVAMAGGAGAVCRFGLSRLVVTQGWQAWPYATFSVNVIGSFLIGYLAFSLEQRWGLSQDVKAILLTGFLGGFTTFSAFSLETILLFEQGAYIKAVAYVVATVVACLLLCAAGALLAKVSLNT